jgi:hypothetical protein
MKNSKISEIFFCPLISVVSFLFVFLSLRSSIGQDIVFDLFDLALRRFMISLILVLNQSGLDFVFQFYLKLVRLSRWIKIRFIRTWVACVEKSHSTWFINCLATTWLLHLFDWLQLFEAELLFLFLCFTNFWRWLRIRQWLFILFWLVFLF